MSLAQAAAALAPPSFMRTADPATTAPTAVPNGQQAGAVTAPPAQALSPPDNTAFVGNTSPPATVQGDQSGEHPVTASAPVSLAADTALVLYDGTTATGSDLAEWRQGYMRQEDYTRKRQQSVAADAQTQALYQQANEFGNFALEVVQASLPRVDNSLRETDRGAWDSQRIDRYEAEQILTRMHQRHQELQAQARQAKWTREGARVTDLVPEWLDPATRTREENAIVDWFRTQGATPEDEQAIRDSAFLVFLAREAMRHAEVRRGAKAGGQSTATRAAQQQPSPAVGAGTQMPVRPAQVAQSDLAAVTKQVRGMRGQRQRMDAAAQFLRAPERPAQPR